MKRFLKQLTILISSFLLFMSCGLEQDKPARFMQLSTNQTGITFENSIFIDDTYNYQNDFLIYNGAGVAVGDINNNGLPDIFFA